ncbi:MAG: septal ring lytic transglycosylase RlpA family protein [Cellvibrionaceae bacterium]
MYISSRAKIIFLSLILVCFSACTTSQKKPKIIGPVIKDGAPSESYSVDHIPDAVPRAEPRTAAGNKSPYTVLGKTYRVMPNSDGFVQKGRASWYGTKFHGRKTSNGEVYDMYGMTAAHKTLPIPTFVRVKNLDNDKEVIVRVNDRGPFHGGRIIDLTYAAAKKLGFQSKGTAPVEVEALDPATFKASAAQNNSSVAIGLGEPRSIVPSQSSTQSVSEVSEKAAPAPVQVGGYSLPDDTYLQAGAFGSENAANNLMQKIASLTEYPVFIVNTVKSAQQLFRVRIGPFKDNWDMVNLQGLIKENKLGSPHIVRD